MSSSNIQWTHVRSYAVRNFHHSCRFQKSNYKLNSYPTAIIEYIILLAFSTMSRFSKPLSEVDLKILTASTIPPETKKKEKWAINLFKKWLTERNAEGILPNEQLHIFKDVDDLTKSDLDYLLSFFILEVRTENGERFKSASLKNLIAMIQYHYNKSLNKGWSVFNDSEFQKSRNSLDVAMKFSRQEGRDGQKRRAEVVEESHEEILWSKNVLGSDNPKQLLYTLVFLIGKNFALRGRDEHRRLQMSNISKQRDQLSGREYLMYVENFSKTTKGGLHDCKREPKRTKAFDNPKNKNRCIVQLYSKYIEHRPAGIEEFYLTPLMSSLGSTWYKKTPLGVNTLSNVTKSLFEQGGISGHFTNHSLKRTARTVLCNSGFGRDIVKKKTGHTSESELDYLELNRTIEMKMSDSLNFCAESSSKNTENNLEPTNKCVIIEKDGMKITINL